MTHLSTDEVVDAVEQTLAVERQAHLAHCGHCAEQVARLRSVLTDVHRVEIPEPSPLFWERLSDNVRRAIASEPAPPRRRARWFEWPVLVPLGALAVLVLALVSAVPQGPAGLDQIRLALSAGGDALDADAPVDSPEAEWEMMAALVGDVDFDSDDHTLAATPGAAEKVVMQLTSAERQELIRLVREELLQERARPLRQELQGSGG
jgi:hypothetical protein